MINLDHASAAPLLPEVKEAVVRALEAFGNPSSIHASGRQAKQALDRARKQVAALINARPSEIYFTSCGTESNNWALRGLFNANTRQGNHLVISSIEHPSVSLVARRLQMEGADVSIIPVDGDAVVAPDALRAAMTPGTVLVSIMLANGEVGTIEPIMDLAAIAQEQGALFHTDAVAAAGHVPIDVRALGVDALSLASNSCDGSPGAAVLFVKQSLRILPLLEGGGQESGGRSGTEALPAIIGMGVAAEVVCRDLPHRVTQVRHLRDQLRDGLMEQIESLRITGASDARLAHVLHVCVDGLESEALVRGLDQAGIAAGLGSACNSKAMRPSHVLKAMGFTDEHAKGALVFTLGVTTTEEEIARALEIVPEVVGALRRVTAMTARS